MTGSFYMMSFCPCIYLSFVKLSGKNIVTVWFLSPLFIQKGFSPLTRNGKKRINLLYTREHNVVCIPISNTQIGKNHNSICSSVQYLTVGWYFIIFEQLKNINRNHLANQKLVYQKNYDYAFLDRLSMEFYACMNYETQKV